MVDDAVTDITLQEAVRKAGERYKGNVLERKQER